MADQTNPAWRFETLSVHAGYSPDPTTKAVAVLSVGIEHIDDLLADLDQALAAV